MRCKDIYQKHKSRFIKEIESFDEADTPTANAKIIVYLKSRVDFVDSMDSSEEDNRKVAAGIQEALTRACELSPTKTIQALVFFFDRDHCEAYLNAYGEFENNPYKDEFSNNNGIDNCVVDELGPITFSAYELLRDDVLAYDELEDVDLEFQNDTLNELLILKAYALFESCFKNVFNDELLSGLSIHPDLHVYIQEHDGGFASRLR